MKRFSITAKILATAVTLGLPFSAMAQVCSKTSPAHTIALLELYTSEGCDSCPAADKFVSSLHKATALTADQVIPLSLHVDYWDYIGWKDVFAKPGFTQRQRSLAELAGSRSVYTPEVFIAGKELRDWRGGVVNAVKRINSQAAQASIQISIDKLAENKLHFSLQGTSAHAAKLHFALVEQSLISKIMAGENRGATLQHDYVAREWGDVIALSAATSNTQSRLFNLPANAVRKNLSVVAFIQAEKGDVLQALSLPLCDALQ
ncbi:MAG: DUF1223 domain-containing protein [Pseudomonadota bacterium]